MSDKKQTPLKLSLGQIGLRNIALNQIARLLGTLKRLDAITGEQADKEVIMDIRAASRGSLESDMGSVGRWNSRQHRF